MAKRSANESGKNHSVEITNGGGLILKQILTTMHWYKGVPLHRAVAASEVPANHLSDLAAPKGGVKAEDNWSEKPLTLSLSEAEREGTKACLRYFVDNAMIELKPATNNLLREFGVLE